MTPLTRGQAIAVGLLAAVLFVVFTWRYQDAVHQRQQPSPSQPFPAVVQVIGAVRAPGFYLCDQEATVGEAVRLAGGLCPGVRPEAETWRRRIASGTRVQVQSGPDGRLVVHLGAIPAMAAMVLENKIDLNRASARVLARIPGISPELAGRIVALRRERGRLLAVDEVSEVKGIGPRRLQALRRYVYVDSGP